MFAQGRKDVQRQDPNIWPSGLLDKMQHHGNGEMAQLVKCELQSQENQE